MKVDLFSYLLGAGVFFVVSIMLGQLRYYESKATCVLSGIFLVAAGLFAIFPVVVFLLAKPDVEKQEYIYETVVQSTDAGIITYKNEDGEVKEKDIGRLPKVYDEDGENNYVAAIRCYTGPFYVVKDCYVYTKESEN